MKAEQKTRVIGITGGAGSGKTRILEFIKHRYDAVIIIADEISRRLSEPGQGCYQAIIHHFGTQICQTDGSINRSKLAEIVFNDQCQLEQLNQIIHPAVKTEINRQIDLHRQAGICYIVIEAALLIEAGYRDICDEMWFIYCDASIRRKRLRESRGYADEKIDAVFRNQLSDASYRENCDLTVDNSGGFEQTVQQIVRNLG